MNQETYISLKAVIDYLLKEEKNHFEENGKPKNHIYRDIKRLIDWSEKMAENYSLICMVSGCKNLQNADSEYCEKHAL